MVSINLLVLSCHIQQLFMDNLDNLKAKKTKYSIFMGGVGNFTGTDLSSL